MRVLSKPDPKDALRGFATKGRYSYIQLLLQFAGDWDVDLPWVRARIAALHTATDCAVLFRDILTAKNGGRRWATHPDARDLLWVFMKDLAAAWENVLSHDPDKNQLTLEYLADALDRFKQATSTS